MAVSHSAMQQLRESPTVLDIVLPEIGTIAALRPAHPSEDIWVELEVKTIEYCLEYIQSFNDSVIEANPRSYSKQDGPDDKLWKMGNGRVCRATKEGLKNILRRRTGP